MVPRNSLSKRVLRQARARARIPSALDIAGVRCQVMMFASRNSPRIATIASPFMWRISRSINVGVVLYFASQFRTVRRSQVLISV